MMEIDKKTLLSIVSFCDTQLIPTIINALEQARNPKSLAISIVEQDTVRHEEEIQSIVDSYGSVLYYEYFTPEMSLGVVWARSLAQRPLVNGYDYYLQVDSHTRFLYHYDSFLANDYEQSKSYFGNMVFSAYSPRYDIVNGQDKMDYTTFPLITYGVLDNSHPNKIMGCVKEFEYPMPYGAESLQISGHFLYGDAKIFIDHPFDPILYWEGEESTFAARLYCDKIKIISPYKIYTWHKYENEHNENKTRIRHDEEISGTDFDYMIEKVQFLKQRGIERCYSFWNNEISDQYGASSAERLDRFLYEEDRTMPENAMRIGF